VARSALLAILVVLAVAIGAPELAAKPTPLPLKARVIAHGEFVGFGPFGPPQLKTVTDAKKWVQNDTRLSPKQVAAAVAALHREGFVAIVSEQLGSTAPYRGGLSWVMELGSPAGALAEVARVVRNAGIGGGPVSRFRVSGIASAAAYRVGDASEGGDNVLFADGRFTYLVGEGWGNGGKPARAALLAAARTLYARVHGRPLP
jgi:hypothetical protein